MIAGNITTQSKEARWAVPISSISIPLCLWHEPQHIVLLAGGPGVCHKSTFVLGMSMGIILFGGPRTRLKIVLIEIITKHGRHVGRSN